MITIGVRNVELCINDEMPCVCNGTNQFRYSRVLPCSGTAHGPENIYVTQICAGDFLRLRRLFFGP